MWFLTITVLIYFLDTVSAVSNQRNSVITCQKNTVQGKHGKLKKYLLDNYDSSNPPCANTTTIDISILPTFLDFSETTNSLSLHCVMSYRWIDNRLSWKKEDFSVEYDTLHLSKNDIWMPDITLHSSGNLNSDVSSIDNICLVGFNGHVSCISSVIYDIVCFTDYTNWPHDSHYCELQLGSWIHTELNFTSKKTWDMWIQYFSNPKWNLVYNSTQLKYVKTIFDSEHQSHVFQIELIIKRHDSVIKATFVAIAFVLVILSLTALYLQEVESIERLTLVCVSFICHLLSIINIHWFLPANGAINPLIFLFYEKSLIITGFTLLLTLFSSKLQRMNWEAPELIKTITAFVFNSKFGDVILFVNLLEPKVYLGLEETDESTAVLISQSGKNRAWRYFSILIGWLSFTLVFIIYLVILAIYIPDNSINYNSNYFRF